MNILRSLGMAFAMFSILPMPKLNWDKGNMRHALAALPTVGLVIGLTVCGWFWLCQKLDFGQILFAAGLTLLPVWISGGIHLDGLMDVSDAMASHAPPARRREIMKDPHTGAFAVMGVSAYLLLYFALCTELPRAREAAAIMALIPVVSRAVGGLGAACFPAAGGAGLLTTFRDASAGTSGTVLAMWFLLGTAGLICMDISAGVAMAAASLLCGGYVRLLSQRRFGGMSGDLAGYLIQLCEIAMLAVFILVRKVVCL